MRSYGYVQDDPDHRDLRFKVARDELITPVAHDLTRCFPPPLNQMQYGTCTAHGVTSAIRYNLLNNRLPDVVLSRSQPYWDAGVIEGNTGDNGRQIRDAVKAVAQKGVVSEEVWGYDKVGIEPPADIYAKAFNRLLEYRRVEVDRPSLNAAIFIGHPIIIGVPVFAMFESEQVTVSGRVPMPGPRETEIGLHCMLMGGYDAQWDRVLNSWGPTWGDGGYCYLPRGYIEKYGSDLWTILLSN